VTRIIVGATLSEKLHHLNELVELCDESGRVLGRFLPVFDLAQYEPLTPQVSEEELRRRELSRKKRYTTAEVLVYLEKLA